MVGAGGKAEVQMVGTWRRGHEACCGVRPFPFQLLSPPLADGGQSMTVAGCRTNTDRLATAYAITKALLPFRLIFSVWATPRFARVTVIPFTNVFRRMFTRGKKTALPSAAAGTGAFGAGAITREAPGTVGSVKTAAGVGKEAETGVKNPPI